ncbi:MAG: hypothetical protein ACT4QC_04850 [Planctomycetaceae bacterium]
MARSTFPDHGRWCWQSFLSSACERLRELIRRAGSLRGACRLALAIALVAILVAGSASRAVSGIYTFTQIARTGGTIAGGPIAQGGTTTFVTGPALNNAGQVAFTYGIGSRLGHGIGVGATPVAVADKTPPFGGSADTFPSINDGGEISFRSALDSGGAVVVKVNGNGGITTIVDTNTHGDFTSLLAGTSINNAGVVAFNAFFGSERVIAIGAGGLPAPFVRSDDFNGSLSGATMQRESPQLGMAFQVHHSLSDSSIWRTVGLSAAPIVDTRDGQFSLLRSGPSIDDFGRVAFSGRQSNGIWGVFQGDTNSITTYADGTGQYDFFSSDVASSTAGVAFIATLDLGQGEGVFLGPNPNTDRLLTLGDTLQGFPSTVTAVEFGSEAFNNHAQLAMRVHFDNGVTRIIRADPLAVTQVLSSDLEISGALKSVQGASFSQQIDAPTGRHELAFDFLFPTTTGRLSISLGGIEVASFDAPATLRNDFATVHIPVDIDRLFPRLPPGTHLALEFFLDGAGTESGVLLDNILFPGVSNGGFQAGDLRDWEAVAAAGGGTGLAVRPGAHDSVPEPCSLMVFVVLGLAATLGRRFGGRD